MKFRVDWVSPDASMFAVVAWTPVFEKAAEVYAELDALPGVMEGVISSGTEESAVRARDRGRRECGPNAKDKKAYFMRLVLPAAKPVTVDEELTKTQVIKTVVG